MINKIKYGFRSMFWTVLGKSSSLIISFSSISIFAFLSPKEIVGSYNFIFSVSVILGIATLRGTIPTLVRSISKGFDGTLTFIIKKRIFFSLWGSLGSLMISFWYLFNKNYELMIIFVALSLLLPFINTLSQSSIAFWQGKKDFRFESLMVFLNQLIIFAVTIPVIILFSNSLLIITLSFFISFILSGLIIFLITKKYRENGKIESSSYEHGKHFSILTGAETIANNIDKVLIWHFLGPISVATYYIALTPIQKIIQIAPIQNVTLPIFSTKTPNKKLDKKIFKTILILLSLSIPVSIAFYIIAPFLYSIFFPKYNESVWLFQLFTILIALMPVSIINSYFIGTLQKKKIFPIKIFSSVFRILSLLILLPILGIIGAVISIIMTDILTKCILVCYLIKDDYVKKN